MVVLGVYWWLWPALFGAAILYSAGFVIAWFATRDGGRWQRVCWSTGWPLMLLLCAGAMAYLMCGLAWDNWRSQRRLKK